MEDGSWQWYLSHNSPLVGALVSAVVYADSDEHIDMYSSIAKVCPHLVAAFESSDKSKRPMGFASYGLTAQPLYDPEFVASKLIIDGIRDNSGLRLDMLGTIVSWLGMKADLSDGHMILLSAPTIALAEITAFDEQLAKGLMILDMLNTFDGQITIYASSEIGENMVEADVVPSWSIADRVILPRIIVGEHIPILTKTAVNEALSLPGISKKDNSIEASGGMFVGSFNIPELTYAGLLVIVELTNMRYRSIYPNFPSGVAGLERWKDYTHWIEDQNIVDALAWVSNSIRHEDLVSST